MCAGGVACAVNLYTKTSFTGDSYHFSLGATQPDGRALHDLVELPEHQAVPHSASRTAPAQAGSGRRSDAEVHSARLSCTCGSGGGSSGSGGGGGSGSGGGGCQTELRKVTLRLYADPARREARGGEHLDLDLTCDPTGAGAEATDTGDWCTGGWPTLPKGWSGRASAAQLLYDSADVRRLLSDTEGDGASPTPSPEPPPPTGDPPSLEPPPSPSSLPAPAPEPPPSPPPGPFGRFTCTATFFVGPRLSGDSMFFLSSPEADAWTTYLPDFTTIQKPANADKWDDKIQSARIACETSCVKCVGDWSGVKLRLFADPYWRKTRGGPYIDLGCESLSFAQCEGTLEAMPKGWGARASAAALLYNYDGFRLPRGKPRPL